MPDTTPLDTPLFRLAAALADGHASPVDLVEEAIACHQAADKTLGAYKLFDADGARAAARRAEERLAGLRRSGRTPPRLAGIPISVKDLYGVEGLPTFAGTPRQLPERWSADAWLVGRLREQGAVVMGKTHTVELALGGVGLNPHWGTPRNPWDAEVHRIPGGSSSGAGVSLAEGSALVALGSDTGGSIRIPASLTGTVGQRTTKGRWPTDGVVPLSSTLDTVGALTRSVEDTLFFFGAVDPASGDPGRLLRELADVVAGRVRIGLPRCALWDDVQTDIGDALHETLDQLDAAGWRRREVDGGLLDEASHLYLTGGIAGAECLEMLARDLQGWKELLHPIVGSRLDGAPTVGSPTYEASLAARERLEARAGSLFDRCEVLALPTALMTPPPVAEMEDMNRYLATNRTVLRPTASASILGFTAISVPVALDRAGMPVGLQLVAPGSRDEELLGIALGAERILGRAADRLGRPPMAPAA